MNISKTTELYRYPSQVCLLCQKWPVDPSRKVTIRAETHKVAGQRAFVAAASPGVRQLEKQKSPFLNLRLLQVVSHHLSPPSHKTITSVKHTFHVSSSTGLSFEARDKLSKRKMLPRTHWNLLAISISAACARTRVEPRRAFWLFFS